MILGGTGASGLAILGLSASEADTHSKKPLRRLPMVWQAIGRDDINDVLCGTLFTSAASIQKSQIPDRGAEFLAECKSRGIRAIVTIGTQALRAVSPVYGRSTKLVGCTITTGEVPYIIPIDTHWSGFRAFRSYAWVRAMGKFVRRAFKLAQGVGHLFELPGPSIGENDQTREDLQRLLDEKLPVGCDIETTGKDFRDDQITAIGFASACGTVSVPWHPYTSNLYGPQTGLRCVRSQKLVKALLAASDIPKIFHNGLFDLSVLRQKGIDVAGPIEDTYLAHKIVYPDLFHNLQFCLSYEHAIAPWKTLFDMHRKARREGDDWSDTQPDALMIYNGQDAAAEIPLWERLSKGLSDLPRGWENYRKLMALGGLAASMQFHGVRIDLQARNALASEMLHRIDGVKKKWNGLREGMPPMAGEGSAKGIRQLLFTTLKAPVVARSMKTGAEQLSGAVLLEYAGSDNAELAQAAWALFEYRKLSKSYDAFLKPLISDRVYARPNPAGTRGSRFSYSEPNLQQWSKEKTIVSPLSKTEVTLAPNLRHLVCADVGFVLGEHDYNALEVRLVAYAASITDWLDWLNRGVDMHTEHATLMFGRKVGKKDPLRQITKVLTFARFYNKKRRVGQVLKALKPSMPTLTEGFLQEVFERFDKARPEVVAWQDAVEKSVTERGYVELPLSGMRQYHDKRMPDINAALSFGIQSTGGDMLNAAALRIHARLDAEAGERILINVHDALLWQARPDRVKQVAAIFSEELEKPVDLWGHRGVVFPTECRVGPNWRDLERFDV